MNTATYRNKAFEAYESGKWEEAAVYYQLAIDAYPEGSGALRNRDLCALENRKDSCIASAAFQRCIK